MPQIDQDLLAMMEQEMLSGHNVVQLGAFDDLGVMMHHHHEVLVWQRHDRETDEMFAGVETDTH